VDHLVAVIGGKRIRGDKATQSHNKKKLHPYTCSFEGDY
jgi:hypothetical protein